MPRTPRRHFLMLPLATAALARAASRPVDLSPPDAWKRLSLRERIGQTVVLSSDLAREKAVGGGSLFAFFGRYPVSGVFLGPWKFQQTDPARRAETVRQLVRDYRQASHIPLFVQDDYEQGPGSALDGFTHLPSLMALGATRSEALAQAYGQTLAREARSLGFNWLLNPVADLNRNPLNPVVNTRALSDDPALAARLLPVQIRAMQDQGLITTAKHFPGDGMDFRDQHIVTTVNSATLAQWRATYGQVWRAVIAADVASVMVGHITLPAAQKQRHQGRLLPASLSSELITGLLKTELGFPGVVISDALNMAGLRGYFPSDLETQIQAFKAGTDLMLWPHLEYFDELEKRLNSGEIPMARLDDAVARVWALKRRFGLITPGHGAPFDLTEAQRAEGQAVARRVAEASLTLLRDDRHSLPLRPQTAPRLLVVLVTPESLGAKATQSFAPTLAALRERGFQVDLRVNFSYYANDMASVAGYDRVLFAFHRHTHAPMGTLQLYETEALTAYSANSLPGAQVIAVSYGDPYVLDTHLPLVPTAINAYSDSAATQLAVVRALCGEIGFAGRTPVDLAALRRDTLP